MSAMVSGSQASSVLECYTNTNSLTTSTAALSLNGSVCTVYCSLYTTGGPDVPFESPALNLKLKPSLPPPFPAAG